MPFFKPANKNIGCVSLQVQKRLNKRIKNKYVSRKRAYLFTLKGSITLEATIALSAFMMFLLFIESFMMLINSALSIQGSINHIAMETSKNIFYMQLSEEAIEKSKTLSTLKEQLEVKLKEHINVSENLKDVIKEGAKNAYLSKRLVDEIGVAPFQEKLCRMSNLKLGESHVSNEIIDIVVEYNIKIPYVNRLFYMVQRGRVRAWTGEDISQNQQKVYITKTGKVYHKTKNCSSLVVKIRKAYYGQIEELRNRNGEKYAKCALCVNETLTDASGIFITEDGNRYHRDLKCGGIKRSIIEIDISQAGSRKPCSKCEQGE